MVGGHRRESFGAFVEEIFNVEMLGKGIADKGYSTDKGMEAGKLQASLGKRKEVTMARD